MGVKTIGLTKVNQTTVVKVYSDGVQMEQYAIAKADMQVSLGGLTIRFPNDKNLEEIGLRFDNLTTATATELGNPTTNLLLLDKLVEFKYFVELA